MVCPQCHTTSPAETPQCQTCGTPFPGEQLTVTVAVAGTHWSAPLSGTRAARASLGTLQSGSILAGRYEILELLGEGGMGAVYKAKDRELDRVVALKVIRPELSGHPEILRRFKRELILARQITHKSVIRIFDLGVADGLKFISMEFVEGRPLAALLAERGKLPPDEAARVIQQVCLGLEAAHAEGVVHRDLKPQNIMLDEHGKVTVMDFGIAGSVEVSDLTRTGALLGTPAYMSPEQAKGQHVDTRSDLFAVGIIFYELLTGVRPFEADTVMGMLLSRVQGKAPPPIEVDPATPRPLSDIVSKSLAVDPGRRYQNATEILQDLEAWQGPRPGTIIARPPARLVAAVRHWKWIASALAALLLAFAGFMLRERVVSKPQLKKAVTLLVADFNNATGDSVFDGSLEPMFTLALEGASFVTSIRRDQALRIGAQLRPGAARLDESLARLVAVREGISVVLAGSIGRDGDGYKVSVRAVDAVTGKTVAARQTWAAGKEKVLATVGKLAAPVRKALGDSTPESVQLAAAETYTAGSLEAAHSYASAQRLRFEGKSEEAIREYLRAVELDQNFGSAYGALAAMYANLGRREEAVKHYQLAMARIERMTDREKYRTRGGYYLAVLDHERAIEEFSALVKQYPADATGLSNLAFAHYLRRDMARALEVGRRALEIYPKNVPYLNNVALYALYAGEFENAAREARAVLELNPSYLKGYVALALSELAQAQPQQAAETYRRLGSVSPLGASFAATGLADLALYEGRTGDAAAILEKAVETDVASARLAAAAKKSAMLAQALLVLGRKPAALAAASRGVGWSKEASIVMPAASVYLETGQEAKAAALASELARRIEPFPQAFAKLIEGEIQLKRGRANEAIRLLQEGLRLGDLWLLRFMLGRAYLEAGAFPQANSEFDRCLKRRGEATDIFLDELQTYYYLPPVYYYLGRTREGLKSPGAAQSYRAFLAIREKGGEDPLAADARRRLAER